MSIRRWGVLASLSAFVVLGFGCGASSTEPSTSSGASEPGLADGEGNPGSPSPLAKKLEGHWEIIRYVSSEAIPPEAMPLLAEMFETLVLRFEGSRVEAGGETVGFAIEEADGDSFLLHAKGGMFDGATCRFVSDDEVEVVDEGEQWPGTSLLRRMKSSP